MRRNCFQPNKRCGMANRYHVSPETSSGGKIAVSFPIVGLGEDFFKAIPALLWLIQHVSGNEFSTGKLIIGSSCNLSAKDFLLLLDLGGYG